MTAHHRVLSSPIPWSTRHIATPVPDSGADSGIVGGAGGAADPSWTDRIGRQFKQHVSLSSQSTSVQTLIWWATGASVKVMADFCLQGPRWEFWQPGEDKFTSDLQNHYKYQRGGVINVDAPVLQIKKCGLTTSFALLLSSGSGREVSRAIDSFHGKIISFFHF